ncbi:MAG: SpoIIE family protein phosphatase [Acidobacteriota bacterium]|nr:SpoIIE family protein phosphatase [Acidobacteriota bacterium]
MQGETILVVDDSEDIRDLMVRRLSSWGHRVLTAADGWEGYEILQREDVCFVITDWSMPLCSGVELCRKVRASDFGNYIYLILLTGRSEIEDLAEGMAAGADDFVTKPFDSSELKARINAGLRILQLERTLKDKQAHLNKVNRELEAAYDKISEDLHFAAQLQKNLLPPPALAEKRFRFESLFYPSRFLAGDIFNIVPLDERYTVCYVLDVSGKGVPAALLSFTLSKILHPVDQEHGENRYTIPLSCPSVTAAQLNKMFQSRGRGAQYFTMNYVVIDHVKHQLMLTQAGHPPAIFVPEEGPVRAIGEGGYPIGLFSPSKVVYRELEIDYRAGDRLFLYSDGATDTFNHKRECFTEERLLDCLTELRGRPMEEILSTVKSRLIEWAGSSDLDDDLTICALELL